MLFFPSITFGLIGAEVFPWAILYVLYRIRSISARLFPLSALMIISVLATTYNFQGQLIGESIRSFVAYANPILLLLILARTSEREIHRLVNVLKYVLVGLLTFGIIQSSGLIQFVDPFVKALVPRGGAEEFGGGRGIMLLSTEPSRAAFEMIFLYSAWRTITTLRSSKIVLTDILFALFIVGIVKSAVGLALISLYLFFIYRSKLILLIIIFAPIFLSMFIDTRAVSIAVELASKASPTEAFELLFNASGFRLVSIISAYYSGFTSLIGSGVGAWPISSIDAMNAAGFSADEISYFVYFGDSEFKGIRPTSYVANIALDMGIVGVACLMYLLIPFIMRAWVCGVSLRPLLGLFLFSIFFYGAVGNPIPWLALILATRYCEVRNSDQNFVNYASNKSHFTVQT